MFPLLLSSYHSTRHLEVMAHCLINNYYAMLLTTSGLVPKQAILNLVYLGQLQAVPLVNNAPRHTWL